MDADTELLVSTILANLEALQKDLNRILSDTILLREECETWKRRAQALETDRLRRGI